MANDRKRPTVERGFVKIYPSWFSGSHAMLSMTSHGLGVWLLSVADGYGTTGDDGVRWIDKLAGAPLTSARLKKFWRMRGTAVLRHLQPLLDVRTLIERESDGCLGFPRFDAWNAPDEVDVIRMRGRRKDQDRPSGFVYFIVAADRVKIGYSANPWARLKELSTGSPVPMRMGAMLPGSRDDEAAYHRKFAGHRVQGEWFNYAPEIAAFVVDRSSTVVTTDDTTKSLRSATNPPSPSPSVSPLEPLFHSLSSTSPDLGERAREPPHSTESTLEVQQRDGKSSKPRRPRIVRAEYPAELADHLFAEINAAAKTLGRRGHRKIGGTMSDDFAKLYGECEPTREDISHVVAVRAAKDRRGEGYGSLSWDSICVPGNFRRWLNEPIGKPAASGRVEPSPRPTQGGTVDLKALVGGKSDPCP